MSFVAGHQRTALVGVQNTGTGRLAGALLLAVTQPDGHVVHDSVPVDIPAGVRHDYLFTYTPTADGSYPTVALLNDTQGAQLDTGHATLTVGESGGLPLGLFGLLGAAILGVAAVAKKV